MNFEFIKELADFKDLYDICRAAEVTVNIDPPSSLSSTRSALEYIVKFIHKTALNRDVEGWDLSALMTTPDFKAYIGDKEVLTEMHSIRKVANVAVHDHVGTKSDAIENLETLQFIVGDFFMTLGLIENYPEFEDPSNIPAPAVPVAPIVKPDEVVVSDTVAAKFAVSMRNAKFETSFKRDPESNRVMFIQACLREAGWPIVEEDNHAKPFCAGKNIVIDANDSMDYVLYGKDGKPIAIVEYSECKENIISSKHKANRVAKKLEAQYGVFPVIYFTNGYMIQLIDQAGVPQRRVFSFHSLEEIDWMIYKRTNRKELKNIQIDPNITDRDYQHKAINAVCDAFSSNRRGSLIVMATGTGKTRVAISIVDVLMRYGWVKNVLFLADRTSLVRQAMKNFKKLMPQVTTSQYSADSITKDPNAKIIFSTYQSMIKIVNGDNRTFGIGRFDLVIVDEAHRSIFTKYAGLFNYFDGLMLGLTATPKYDQDRSSYEVFKLPKPEPDFAYELNAALEDGYLVPFHIEDRTTEKNLRKFKYSDLSAQEIQEIEDSLAENYSMKEIETFRAAHSDKSGVRSQVINRSTIRLMLDDLMNTGLKLADGTLGKTIIFASSHEEAVVIVEEFNKMFSQYGVNYCKVIDSKIPEKYPLIDKLEDRDSGLQIAVSVEMLETGVDIPDLLNLVFFKSTYSKIKFLQMIGRGTRLSKDLFGPGNDKKGFFVFDYFDNFRFFSTGATWSTIGGSGTGNWRTGFGFGNETLAINKLRLSIAHYTQTHPVSEFEREFGKQIVEELILTARQLKNDDISIQYNLPYINKYRDEKLWESLTEEKVQDIADNILSVFPGDGTNAQIRTFDHLMYSIEEQGIWLSERQPKKGSKTMRDLRLGTMKVEYLLDQLASTLKEYVHIPEVKAKEAEIDGLRDGNSVLDDFSIEKCEKIRKSLRDLMVHIQVVGNTFVIDVQDSIVKEAKGEVGGKGVVVQGMSYPEKANEYLIHSNCVELKKLRSLEKLNDDEKKRLEKIFMHDLGTKVDYAMWSNNKPLLVFLRSQVGISDEAIQTQFGSFLNEDTFTAEQLEAVKQIIEIAKVNGDVTPTILSGIEPFKSMDFMKFFGDTGAVYVRQILTTIHSAIL